MFFLVKIERRSHEKEEKSDSANLGHVEWAEPLATAILISLQVRQRKIHRGKEEASAPGHTKGS